MTKKRYKPLIVIAQRMIPYYRVPFFNLLAAHNSGFEINVCHGSATIGGNILPTFRSNYYKNYVLNLFGYSLVFQPALMLNVVFAAPDLLILEGTFGVITNFFLLLYRRAAGYPTLYWTAGWDNPAIKGWRARLKSLFIRMCLALCDGTIVYGQSALKYLVEHGLSKDRIVIAQNTVDVEALTNNQQRWKELGEKIRKKYCASSNKLIIYVGQLSVIKRVDVLLSAFFSLRTKRNDLTLCIVGDGEQSDELKQFVQTNQIPDVHFIGEVVEGVEAYFSAGDLFVLPGTGGLALNQAMALGLPVIATIADGTESDLIVPGENGYIVPVDNVNDLADAIEKILGSSQLHEKMAANSKRIILEKATLFNMVEKYSTAIQKALNLRSVE
jgi:glycosyltransferase involved in cell wall biosynthesis